MKKASGKSHRKGLTLVQLIDLFPDEDSARVWFEECIWPGIEGDLSPSRFYPYCGSFSTYKASHPKCPYRCRSCRKYFSVKTRTVLGGSKVPLRKWVIAIYLETTHLKGISSMKLHRVIGVTQKTAWFMLHRIREALKSIGEILDGFVEVDETYIGGKEKNKHFDKKLNAGRGGVGKSIVVGAKERDSKTSNSR